MPAVRKAYKKKFDAELVDDIKHKCQHTTTKVLVEIANKTPPNWPKSKVHLILLFFISQTNSFFPEFAFIFTRISKISQLNGFLFRLNIYEKSQFVTLLVTVNLFWNLWYILNENTNIKFKRSSLYILVVNNINLASMCTFEMRQMPQWQKVLQRAESRMFLRSDVIGF